MSCQLLRRCFSGDPIAWERLLGMLYPIITRAVRCVLRCAAGHRASSHTVEDLVQETFLRLLRNDYALLRRFDPRRASLGTWCSLVARSVVLDHLRRPRLDTCPLRPVHHALVAPSMPLQHLDAVDRAREVLTTHERRTLALLIRDGLTVPEVAKVENVTPQTIYSRKHKIFAKLQKED